MKKGVLINRWAQREGSFLNSFPPHHSIIKINGGLLCTSLSVVKLRPI